ncbi:hypothetical protein J5226_01930 [Lysobacter sp. K5869]|uniref:hypothetical protein n=1 Tax=Lysobacter sp. K5869 TaxID=2820808 RepID=UPI001C06177B|nr:hypothetical protein [Lysobacter sp. K5869]QWP77188.1 hypothetical protein J5226_01930 [Lysobacter sp. K5869]
MKSSPVAVVAASAALVAALAACSKPQPPEKERPVDPQATQMRDAIQKPIEKAKSVEPSVDQGAQQTRDAVEAQGG